MKFPKGIYRVKHIDKLVAKFDGEGGYTYIYSEYLLTYRDYRVANQRWWPKRFHEEWEPCTKLDLLLLGIDTQDKTK